ncbi:hypothetical protein ACFCX0_38770 [Streptomyces sp. NPDC056352]|uniref:hypothetical protein n=1 Tax=Streptomyces sp. NPDC056352 TaxID=3345791 RepID=UPI0035DBC3A3
MRRSDGDVDAVAARARTRRDRLEVLNAPIGGPEFDPVPRGRVLKVPPGSPAHASVTEARRQRNSAVAD